VRTSVGAIGVYWRITVVFYSPEDATAGAARWMARLDGPRGRDAGGRLHGSRLSPQAAADHVDDVPYRCVVGPIGALGGKFFGFSRATLGRWLATLLACVAFAGF
jgi:hypothetical protein